MTNTSWFPNALDARNNQVKDQTVHAEIRGVEAAILTDVGLGNLDSTVSNATLMTSGAGKTLTITSIDPVTNFLTVPLHPFSMGDTVTVSSTGYLPPPLLSNGYYYVIYIDTNTIALAASRGAAQNLQPLPIQFSQGVGGIEVTEPGSGYLLPPAITITGGNPTDNAQASAVLQSYGSVNNVSLTTSGSGFTSSPGATVQTVGTGADAAAVSFLIVGGTLTASGTLYSLNDILTLVGGVGTAASFLVTGVVAGSVTAVSLLTPGSYTVLPPMTDCSTVSSTGNGVTLNLSAGILSIPLISGGQEYLQTPLIQINGGGGSGATAIAVLAGGAVNTITVTTPGSGYTSQPTVTILSGTGATVTPRLTPTTLGTVTLTNSSIYSTPPVVDVISNGSGAVIDFVTMQTVSATLVNGGSGYLVGDVLYISGGTASTSTQIQVQTVDSKGAVSSYNIINNGSYTALPVLFSNNTVGGTGSGASFNLSMGVLGLSMTQNGSGYLVPPLVVFTDPTAGGGTGATGHCEITGGIVTSLFIDSVGSGYLAIPTVVITTGAGAIVDATLQPSTVASINAVFGGSDYTDAPQIQISGGGGSGATAVATVSGGVITSVTITNPGSGYTSSPDVIVAGNALLQATLTPVGIASLTVVNAGKNYVDVPQIKVQGVVVATASLTPTSILAVDVIQGGALYDVAPTLIWSIDANQVGNPILPITEVNLSYGIASVTITLPGDGYSSIPTISFSAPSVGGTVASAVAMLGIGSGTFSITQYLPGNDYYLVWQTQAPSDPRLTRVYTDQMAAVMAYFTNLGYTISQITNPNTGDTMSWSIQW